MRLVLGAFVTLTALAVLPANLQAQPASKVFASADQVQAMIGSRKSGLLASLGTYKANLITHIRAQTAAIKQKQVELIYVLAGSGALEVGGVSQQVAKGAAIFIPPNTPYQFTKLDGPLSTISILLPDVKAPSDSTNAKPFASVEDFHALVSAGKNDTLVALPPYRDVFQYRKEPQNALLHQNDDEFVYIADGTGNFTVGGILKDPKPTTPGNSSGSGITGGTSYKVAPGAVIFVPANSPHQFNGIAGAIVSIDLHLPHAD